MNGFSFDGQWNLTQNDEGCEVDILENDFWKDNKLGMIDHQLELKLREPDLKVYATERTPTDFHLTPDEREYLIIRWGAHFDAEFWSRNKYYMRGYHLTNGFDWDSPFNKIDGYGSAGEQIVEIFTTLGYDLGVSNAWYDKNNFTDMNPNLINKLGRGYQNYDIGIRFSQPDSFHACPGKFKIGWSMWEFPEFPKHWIDGANVADINFVPCGWNRILWEKAGVTKPIITIPLGINPKLYPYIDRDYSTLPFTFLVDGSILGDINIIPKFKEIFGDREDVRLVVKERAGDERRNVVMGNITSMVGRLTPQEMLDWYASGHVFLYPTSAEGFGLYPLEAMATGLTVIMTDNPAMKTFCRKDICIPSPVKNIDWYHYPDLNDFAYYMTYVFENRDNLKAIGKMASDFAHQHLTYNDTARKIIEVLK